MCRPHGTHSPLDQKMSFKDAGEFVRHCLRTATIYQKSVVVVIDNAHCLSDLEAVFLDEEFYQH